MFSSGYTCTSDTTDFRGGVWGYTVAGATSGKSVDCTVGPAMQIRWKEEDLEALETNPLTPGLALGGDETATTTSPPTFPTADRESTTTIQPRPAITSDPETTDTAETTTETTDAPDSSPIPDTPETTETTEQTGQPTRFLTVVTTLILSGGSMSISTVTAPAGTSGLSTSLSRITTTSEVDDSPTEVPPSTSSEASNSGGKIMGNPIALTVVFLSCLFVGLGLVSVAYVMFRRHRNKGIGQGEEKIPVGVGVWVQRSGERLQAAAELQGSAPAWASPWGSRAELGTDGPIPELGTGSSGFGSRDNPAELDGREVAASRHRWSWLSHVSEKLSVRSKSSKSSRAPSRGRAAMPRRTLSEASDASTSTISSVNSEKALLSRHGSR